MQIECKHYIGEKLFILSVKNNNELTIERVIITSIRIFNEEIYDYCYVIDDYREVSENDLYDETEIKEIFKKFINNE